MARVAPPDRLPIPKHGRGRSVRWNAEPAPAARRPRRHADGHLDCIRRLPCCICGNDIETEAAHLRMPNRFFCKLEAGIGAKPDDCWTTPLCGEHHDEQHRDGEPAFWRHHGINPFVLALSLWRASGDIELMTQIVYAQRDARGLVL